MTVKIIILIILFYVLGRSADLAIFNLRKIADKLGIKIFFLGLILGFLTSLPELAIGIQSLINNVPSLSFGNLLGGVVMLLTLVVGLNLILNRQIETKNHKTFIIILCYFFLPLILGLDGSINFFESLILIGFYFSLVAFLYYQNNRKNDRDSAVVRQKNSGTVKEIMLFLLGVTGVLLMSDLIIRFTLDLLAQLPISTFVVGLVIFSFGTNFPEITVAVKAWIKGIKQLSMSNLIGSAMANILILGVLSSIKSMTVRIDVSYYLLGIFSLLLFVVLFIFHRSHNTLSRREGLVLVAMYVAFVGIQIAFDTVLNF